MKISKKPRINFILKLISKLVFKNLKNYVTS